MMKSLTATCLTAFIAGAANAEAASPSFKDFDARARHGERLTVVFFGASLTWGANASDPAISSYRAYMAENLEKHYPKAHFKFYDAAIGGTGSQLGVFRLDHDVLSRKPDLVFLDFSANDDICGDSAEQNASYESLVRRLIVAGHVPVVQVIFPFRWNVQQGNTGGMKRRDIHIAISSAYNTAVGDAITLAIARVKSGETTISKIWPMDGAHPCDEGYKLFADAAMQGFLDGVRRKALCKAPDQMIYDDKYMTQARVKLSSLGPLPAGWSVGRPNLTAAFHDAMMSRWLDDESIASNRKTVKNAGGKDEATPVKPERFVARVKAKVLMLYGEETLKSGKYRVYIDGKAQPYTPWGSKESTEFFDASSARSGGNHQLVHMIAQDLDSTAWHTVEIEPAFADDKEQELRLESICVAGGDARVEAAPPAAAAKGEIP